MNTILSFSKHSKILIKKIRFLFFVFIFLITPNIIGQELSKNSLNKELNVLNENLYKVISFGEKINFGKIENSIVWTIYNNDSNIKSLIYGNEINNYTFETPGTYKITFNESKTIIDDECNHDSFPEVLLIKVSPYKMDFDFSTIQYSKKLEPGTNLENCLLTIDVHLKSFANDKVTFPNGKFVSAGIGTTINGKLLNEVVLKPGTNNLTYKISGSATKHTHIMFDFFDINNQVQSYYFQTKL